ncbi:MAG: TlpA disulfide reductase family protein [Alphaproteobacteria bacterium]
MRLPIFIVGALIAVLTLSSTQAGSRVEPPTGFLQFSTPRAIPDIRFEDAEGRTISLTQFRGRLILVNLWATWCEPCRREMPSLDRLQAMLGGPAFEVVAISLDYRDFAKARAFYRDVGIRSLGLYLDSPKRLMADLSPRALPTTLLIDAEGHERGWQTGPTEWDSPAMVAFLKDQIAQAQKRPAVRP